MSSSTFEEATSPEFTPGVGSGRRVVVVGYDGSANSRAALLQGAQQAGREGRVIVVRAVPASQAGSLDAAGAPPRRYAESVASLLGAVRRQLPTGMRFEVRVVAGPVAEALAETARHHATSHVVIGASAAVHIAEDCDLAGSLRALTAIPVETVPAIPPASPPPRAADQERAREELARLRANDRVDASGEGSFPASDPPSSWAGVTRHPG